MTAAAPLARLGRLARRARSPVVAAFLAALIGLSAVYMSNSYERDRDIGAERGDGKYRPILATSDGHKIYLTMRSLVLDRDLDMTNDFRDFRYSGGIRTNPEGQPYFPHSVGVVFAWVPFFTVAHGASKVANLLGADIASHGYTEFHQRITLYSSVLFAFFAAVLGLAVARRWVGGRLAPPVAALAGLLGTSLYYYATYLPSYNHAANALASGGFLAYWALTVGQLRWRRFVWLGVLLGIAAQVRVVGLALGIVVAIELGWRWLAPPIDERGARARMAGALVARGALALGIALIAFAPQCIVWKIQTGEYITSPNGAGYVDLRRPFLAEFLWSSVNGFFATHPLSYASAIGLVVAPRRARLVAIGFLAVLVSQAYINACVYDWSGFSSFGARRMCGTTVVQIFGLACLMSTLYQVALRRLPRVPRRVWLGVGLFAVVWFSTWNVIYASAYRATLIEKVKPRPMCCKGLPAPLSTVAQPVYDAIGNPFALPASALWAWRYDVPIEKWDRSVGLYAAKPRHRWLVDQSFQLNRPHFWNLPGVNFEPWLIRGFGKRRKIGKRWVRWTTDDDASLFVPLFLPCEHKFSFRVRPNIDLDDPPMRVRVDLNGHTVFDDHIGPRFGVVEFTVGTDVIDRGTNVMTIHTTTETWRITPATMRGARITPPEAARVGAAITGIQIYTINPRR